MYEYQHEQTGDKCKKNTKKIDHVKIPPKLLPLVKHSGFLPWNQILESDHCTRFIDFWWKSTVWRKHRRPHPQCLPETLHRLPRINRQVLQTPKWKIKKQEIEKALSDLIKKTANNGWTKKREQDYNNIDAKLTTMMKNAEKYCVLKTTNTSMWSTNLEVATWQFDIGIWKYQNTKK